MGRYLTGGRKLPANKPTRMRLGEREVLEKIASAGHLDVVLGEKGLAERMVNVLQHLRPWAQAIGLGACSSVGSLET